MANQEPVDIAAHNTRKALGTVGAIGIHAAGGNVNSEHPTSGGNANARRRNYAAGTQDTSGSG